MYDVECCTDAHNEMIEDGLASLGIYIRSVHSVGDGVLRSIEVVLAMHVTNDARHIYLRCSVGR